MNHSHVGAIGSQDTWWGKAGIHHDLVEGAKLVGLATTTEGSEVFAILVKTMYVVGRVTIGNK